MRFWSGNARPPPLLTVFHCMIGCRPASLAFASSVLELGEGRRRLGHPDLRGLLLVVEDAGRALFRPTAYR